MALRIVANRPDPAIVTLPWSVCLEEWTDDHIWTELEQRLGMATQPLEGRMRELEQRLAALSRQVAEGGSDATRAGTRVVLAERLHDALREGAPYADVLAGFVAAVVEVPQFGALAAGVPLAEGVA